MLRPAYGLRSLSLTCRSLRMLCMPVLFESCTVTVKVPLSLSQFLPSRLWSLVRYVDSIAPIASHLVILICSLLKVLAPCRRLPRYASNEASVERSRSSLRCGSIDLWRHGWRFLERRHAGDAPFALSIRRVQLERGSWYRLGCC